MTRFLFAFTLLLSTALAAETDRHDEAGDEHSLKISPEIRELLNQEMQAIRKGMESLVFDAAAGNWPAIENTGRSIRDSYLMKKQLSEAQRHELHSALPARFREMDQAFHHYAGMLSHVAMERDIGLVHYYMYKMNEACSSCHVRYAKDKFPGFGKPNKHMRHSH